VPSARKLFAYLFYMQRKYAVTVTFMMLMSCQLCQCLLHVWRGLEQSLIDDAVD